MRFLLLMSLAALLSLTPKITGAATFGLCYTSIGSSLLSPEDIVSMYTEHRFSPIRLYTPDSDILRALHNSCIEVVVGIPNDGLEPIAAMVGSAHQWVRAHILPHHPTVHFKYIVVGDEPVVGPTTTTYHQLVLQAMKNLHEALTSVGLEHEVKVSTTVSAMSALIPWSHLPSNGAFLDDRRANMASIAMFLADHDTPLLANVYPYYSYVDNRMGIPLSYALGTSDADVIKDGQLGYRSLFDAMLDSLYAALEKVGAPDLRVVVSETGWPVEGQSSVATTANAKLYMWNLKRHVSSGEGTPRRPGGQIETYVSSMFADKAKHAEENFGLFYPNKNLVYNLV